jgi:hypothetical protein
MDIVKLLGFTPCKIRNSLEGSEQRSDNLACILSDLLDYNVENRPYQKLLQKSKQEMVVIWIRMSEGELVRFVDRFDVRV